MSVKALFKKNPPIKRYWEHSRVLGVLDTQYVFAIGINMSESIHRSAQAR